MATLFTYFKHTSLRSNVNSSYLLIVMGELIFTLFYGVQVLLHNSSSEFCNMFFFLTQFSLNMQFYAYLFLIGIFIINFHRPLKSNFFLCNSFTFLISIFQTVIADQMFMPDEFRKDVICFQKSSDALFILVAQQCILFMLVLWL